MRARRFASKWTASARCLQSRIPSLIQAFGRVAEWFKAPVLKTGRGFTLPRGFESHPFRQTKFGKKLDQKDQNWIVSSASVPRHYPSKGGYKCSDEPF